MSGERPRSKVTYNVLLFLIRTLSKIFYRLSVLGQENIPTSGAVIIVANHSSYLDPPLLARAATRPVFFMAKEDLFRVPLLGQLLKAVSAFPVNRKKRADLRAFKTALKLLAEGDAVALFPEGTRQHFGYRKLGPLYTGAAYLALKSRAPVIPVGITGTDRIMPPGKLVPRFPKITITIGKPPNFTNAKLSHENISKLTGEIEKAIIELIL